MGSRSSVTMRCTGSRSERSSGNRLLRWGKAAVLGVVLLQTLSCLLLWGRSTRLQSALDAQAKDSRLREQVLHSLQAQQPGFSCPSLPPRPSISASLAKVFAHTKDLAEMATARARNKTGSIWERLKHQTSRKHAGQIMSDALLKTKATVHDAGTKLGRATQVASNSVVKGMSRGFQSVCNGTRSTVRSPVWKRLGARYGKMQRSVETGFGRFLRGAEKGFHRHSHSMAKRFARRVHKTRRSTRSVLIKFAKWQCSTAENIHTWARSASSKIRPQLPTKARFSRFMQRAAGFYGTWLAGARFH